MTDRQDRRAGRSLAHQVSVVGHLTDTNQDLLRPMVMIMNVLLDDNMINNNNNNVSLCKTLSDVVR